MKKKWGVRVAVICSIFVLAFGANILSFAWAQSESNFIISTGHVSMWVINKSTRKLMFLKYQDENKVWQSDQITVPSNIDLNNTVLIATGREATLAFLYDESSGFVTLYEVKKDRSIKKYVSVDLTSELK